MLAVESRFSIHLRRLEMGHVERAGRGTSASRKIGRVFLSVFGAGITYVTWMAAFLLLAESAGWVRALLWIAAPAVTALGFAGGAFLHERLVEGRSDAFPRIYAWPLVGCIVGAAVVFPFGPMLIVFGMFILGTASVVLRELMRGKAWQCRGAARSRNGG